MEQFTDYYAVLGVNARASNEVIKKAFKRLALQYHPDVYKGQDADEKMRAILLAYQTLSDPARRHSYDLVRIRRVPGSPAPLEYTPGESDAARQDRQPAYTFPVFSDGAPAQLDLGEITYLLSAHEVRRLKEDGMLRGAKTPSVAEAYYCHRCHHHWQTASLPVVCPNCKARDWREYLLLRCQHCQAVFESEQIRY